MEMKAYVRFVFVCSVVDDTEPESTDAKTSGDLSFNVSSSIDFTQNTFPPFKTEIM